MSLPAAWVDRVFDKLTVTYGHHFLGRWSGMNLDAVKADWGRELSRFQQNPQAIGAALESLPANDPPTVLQFRALCSQACRDERQALPDNSRPAPNLEHLRAELSRLRAQSGEHHPLEWVDRLLARQAAGEVMSPAQRDALKFMATRHVSQPVIGDFKPPSADVLPPGMRTAETSAEATA